MVCAMVASAQLYVGGGLGYAKSEVGGVDKTEWSIRPEVGYTLNDNWAFGVALGYSDVKDASSTFSVNPYARYTFLRAGSFSIFADGGANFNRKKPDTGDSVTTWGLSVKPGVAYAINENFSIVAHLGDGLYYNDLDEDKEYGLDFGNGLSFSLYYSF